MMICKYYEMDNKSNSQKATAFIVSDTQPYAISGEYIEQMPDHIICSCGSVCIDVDNNKKYMVSIDGNWREI